MTVKNPKTVEQILAQLEAFIDANLAEAVRHYGAALECFPGDDEYKMHIGMANSAEDCVHELERLRDWIES